MIHSQSTEKCNWFFCKFILSAHACRTPRWTLLLLVLRGLQNEFLGILKMQGDAICGARLHPCLSNPGTPHFIPCFTVSPKTPVLRKVGCGGGCLNILWRCAECLVTPPPRADVTRGSLYPNWGHLVPWCSQIRRNRISQVYLIERHPENKNT